MARNKKPVAGVCAASIGFLVLAAWGLNMLREDAAVEAEAQHQTCRRNVTTACGRPLHLGAAPACLACVWQPCAELYGQGAGRACAPIEALRTEEWRHDARRGAGREGQLTGAAFDPRTGAINDDLTMKAALLGGPRKDQRKVYVDLGANTYASSIGNWFRASYPSAADFEVFAFEAERKYDRTYERHPDVTLLPFAVWTANESVPWGFLAKGERRRSGFVTRRLRARHEIVRDATRPGIDIADFLRRTVREEDFVVVKMDIEGAEYDVCPHLIEEGCGHLIDELFIEVHTDSNTCCKPPHDAGRHRADALRLLQRLRDAGVYAHEWL